MTMKVKPMEESNNKQAALCDSAHLFSCLPPTASSLVQSFAIQLVELLSTSFEGTKRMASMRGSLKRRLSAFDLDATWKEQNIIQFLHPPDGATG